MEEDTLNREIKQEKQETIKNMLKDNISLEIINL